MTDLRINNSYSKEMLELGRRMFPLLALALELDENFFADKVSWTAEIMTSKTDIFTIPE